MKWFRIGNSSCPYCRSTPNYQQQPNTSTGRSRSISRSRSNRLEFQARYTFVRRYSTRKNAPKQLKQLVNKLKKQELKLKTHMKNRINWINSIQGQKYKHLQKISEKHNKNAGKGRYRYNNNNSIRNIKHQIAFYPVEPVPVRERVNR
jgi:hypothetical protein